MATGGQPPTLVLKDGEGDNPNLQLNVPPQTLINQTSLLLKPFSTTKQTPFQGHFQHEGTKHFQLKHSYLEAVTECCSKDDGPATGPRNPLALDLESMAFKPTTTYKGKPTVVFPFSEKQSLVDKLKFVLVGKFSHGMPPLGNIRKFFNALKLTGSCNVSLFDKKHIFIECSFKSDYNYVWMHCSWAIDSFVMRVFKWTADFHPSKESAVVPAWIRIEGLPLYFFQERSLLSIANTIGNPLKVDPRNVARTMVNSARICVELDLSKPLVDCLRINFEDEVSKEVKEGFWARVFYDGVPHYCVFCYHIGHSLGRCKRRVEQGLSKANMRFDAVVPRTTHNSGCIDGLDVGNLVDASTSSACAAGAGSADIPVSVDRSVIAATEASARDFSASAAEPNAQPAAEPISVAVTGSAGEAAVGNTAGQTVEELSATSRQHSAGIPCSTAGVLAAVGSTAGQTVAGKSATRNTAAGHFEASAALIIGSPMKFAAENHPVETAEKTLQEVTKNGFTTLEEEVLVEDITVEEGEFADTKFAAPCKHAELNRDTNVNDTKKSWAELVEEEKEQQLPKDLKTIPEFDIDQKGDGVLVEQAYVDLGKFCNNGKAQQEEALHSENSTQNLRQPHDLAADASREGSHTQEVDRDEDEINGTLADLHKQVTGLQSSKESHLVEEEGKKNEKQGKKEETSIISQLSPSEVKACAKKELEKVFSSSTSTLPSTPNPLILDKVGNAVPLSEIIEKSARVSELSKELSEFRNLDEDLKGENGIDILRASGNYDKLVTWYTIQILRTLEDHRQTTFYKEMATDEGTPWNQEVINNGSALDDKQWTTDKTKDYTTEKATTVSQEVIPDGAAEDKKEWTTVKRRSQRLNKKQGK